VVRANDIVSPFLVFGETLVTVRDRRNLTTVLRGAEILRRVDLARAFLAPGCAGNHALDKEMRVVLERAADVPPP
jgi:hypothetical protein